MANRYSRRKKLRRPLADNEPAELSCWRKTVIAAIIVLLVIAFAVVRLGRMLR
jgi:hypothetical protein